MEFELFDKKHSINLKIIAKVLVELNYQHSNQVMPVFQFIDN